MADGGALGYGGLFLGSFLAPTILPLSSEVVLAAMVIGGFDPVACVVVASAGNWLGGMTSYFLGYAGKWAWVERLFAGNRDKVARVRAWVDRYGACAALLCWLPGRRRSAGYRFGLRAQPRLEGQSVHAGQQISALRRLGLADPPGHAPFPAHNGLNSTLYSGVSIAAYTLP